MTTTQLEALAAEAKDLIRKAETGRVYDYVEAGKKLAEAKTAVRKAKRKWGEWLAENGIPQRTATRAMSYAKDPDKYREERVKDAFAKKVKAQKIGQTSGQKKALMKIVQEASEHEVNILLRIIIAADEFERLRGLIPEDYRKPVEDRAPDAEGNGSVEGPTREPSRGHMPAMTSA